MKSALKRIVFYQSLTWGKENTQFQLALSLPREEGKYAIVGEGKNPSSAPSSLPHGGREIPNSSPPYSERRALKNTSEVYTLGAQAH